MSTQEFDLLRKLETPRLGFAATVAILLAAWLALILALGAGGAFHAGPQEAPVATIIAMLLPPLLFLLLLMHPAIRADVLAIDPVWLTAMQGLRILGAGFLFVHAFGHLPGLFAHTAGWGDILVAFLAPVTVARLAADPAFMRNRCYLGFHVLGMLDFIGAVVSGLLARGTIPLLGMPESTAALGQLPLLLIPCFAVPLWICLHITAFIQIRESHRAARL